MKIIIAIMLLNMSMANASTIVNNGDFEAGSFSGWTISGNVNISSLPSEGTFAANFGLGDAPSGITGAISQDLTTVIGQSYSLSFDYGINGDPNDQMLQVELIAMKTNDGWIFLSS